MLVERVLELALKRADGAQVTYSVSESTPVSFENDRLKTIKVAQTSNISLRVVLDGKEGTSNTNDVDDLEGLVDRAVETARYGSPVHYTFPPKADAQEVKLFDPAVSALTREQMVQTGQLILDAIKAYNPELLVDVGVSKSESEFTFLNSAGAHFTSSGTQFSIGASAQRVRGEDVLYAWKYRSWRASVIDPQSIADGLIEKLRLAERDAQIPSGRLPVLFTPDASYVLLTSLAMGVNGKNVLKGDSPLAAKLGQKVFDESLSVTDNGLVDYASGSKAYDGEGVPVRITPIVERGVLVNFLYDLDTAGEAGTQSTGNGPGCHAHNTIVSPGTTPYAEMLRSIDRGLLVDSVMGFGQSNIMQGDFSVNVSLGYLIEKGEVVGRVKNVMLADNSYEALKEVQLTAEAEWIGGSTYAPAMLVPAMSVISKS
ncbi:MAG: TldD/PmbA family protein [Armatimonadota bacterium]